MEETPEDRDEGTYTPPRPGAPLIVCSVLVMVGCILAVSAGIAGIVSYYDPCLLVGGVVLLLPFVLLGLAQYGATFRGSRRAARAVSFFLIMLGGLFLFGYLANAGEGIVGGIGLWIFVELLPIMLAPAVILLAIGILNRRWARTLRLDARDAPADDRSQWRFSTRELLLTTAVVAVVSALATYSISTKLPDYAEHVAIIDAPFGLPPGATDICYAKLFRGTIAYEFTTDEATFREWVADGIGSFESQAANIPLEPIKEPFHMTRYFVFAPKLNGPDSIVINQGLYYYWSKEDRGVHAAFDRQTGRAYYFYHGH